MRKLAQTIGCSILLVAFLGCDTPGSSSGAVPPSGTGQLPHSGPTAQTPLSKVSSADLKKLEERTVASALSKYPKSAACMLYALGAASSTLCSWDYSDCMDDTITKNFTFDVGAVATQCGDRTYGQLDACAQGVVQEAVELWDYLSVNSCNAIWGTPVQFGVADACTTFEQCF